MPLTLRSGDSRLLNAMLIFSWKFEPSLVLGSWLTLGFSDTILLLRYALSFLLGQSGKLLMLRS